MMKQDEKKFDEIECPKCGHSIPISEALRHQMTEELKGQMEQKEKDFSLREKELKDKASELKHKEEAANKVIEEKVRTAVANQQKELKQREAKIIEAENAIDTRVKEGLSKERSRLEVEAKKKAEEAMFVEIQDAKSQLQETKEKLKLAEKAELDLRKRERELKEKQQNIELETARQLSTQRAEVEENVSKKYAEEHRLKDAEKDKVIQSLKVALEDANRKAQQGSQQLQGEVQEIDIEAILKEQFVHDEIVPVPKGISGADALQIVKMPSGTVCGSILWESKRTKNWSEGWVKKLKDDQREAKADIAVIISEVLPKDLPNSGFRDRVWIGNYVTLRLLSVALRTSLVGIASAKLASENKDEISDLLFRYVTGPEFRQKVEAMIDTYKDMRETVEKEKRAAIARWAKQEKQIEKVVAITAGTYGDLRGLIGSSMQSIPALEAGDEPNDTSEKPPLQAILGTKKEIEDIDPEDIPF